MNLSLSKEDPIHARGRAFTKRHLFPREISCEGKPIRDFQATELVHARASAVKLYNSEICGRTQWMVIGGQIKKRGLGIYTGWDA